VGGASQAVDPRGRGTPAHRRPRLRPRARPPAAGPAARYRPRTPGRCPQRAPPLRGHPGSQPCGWRNVEAKLKSNRPASPRRAPSTPCSSEFTSS
jgi:hypothetical protein